MTCPWCPRCAPDWPEWGPVSFPDSDSGKHRFLSLHAVQHPGPVDQPSPELPGQLRLLPGAFSGSPDHVPEVQNHQAVVALAGAQQQLPVVGRVVYQLAPFRDFPPAHFYFEPCNIQPLVPSFVPVSVVGQLTAPGHVLGPSGHCCPHHVPLVPGRRAIWAARAASLANWKAWVNRFGFPCETRTAWSCGRPQMNIFSTQVSS